MFNLNSATLISRIVTLIIAFTVHEFSHAFVANAYGDDTPRMNGRLTLNPIAHLDIMGSILLLIAGFGWAKPVPINPYVLKQRSRSAVMWVSLAGPLSNLLMAFLAAMPLRFGLVPYSTTQSGFFPTPFYFLLEFIIINLSLMVFNLLPVSPLDGEKVLEFLLPTSALETFNRIRPYGPIILMVAVFALPYIGIDLIGMIMTPIIRGLIQLFVG
jgi:Zn-dependent protease